MIPDSVASIALEESIRVVEGVDFVVNTDIFELLLLYAEELSGFITVNRRSQTMNRAMIFDTLVDEIRRFADFLAKARKVRIVSLVHFIIELIISSLSSKSHKFRPHNLTFRKNLRKLIREYLVHRL